MSHCREGERCVCGGDTKRVREACSMWVKSHPDDDAVDAFAEALKAKLAKKRAEGYGGWDDPNRCDLDYLFSRLHQEVAELVAAKAAADIPEPEGALTAAQAKALAVLREAVDVGNFAMMIFNRVKATL